MKKVDVFIVGQPKSGTTAMAEFLSQHPQICMSIPKEPAYFATDFMRESDEFHKKKSYFKARTLRDYEKHFEHAKSSQLLVDASTCYLYSKVASKNIKEYNKDAKVIMMLRNPVDFMYSLHMEFVNDSVEDETDFIRALELEESRKKGLNIPKKTRCPSYHYYQERAKYYDQIKRYFDSFAPKSVLVITNDEFKSDNSKVYKEVLNFIGIDDKFSPDFKIVHGSKKPRSKLINNLVHTIWLKNLLYRTLGQRLYTKTHKQVNKLLLSSKERGPISAELRKRLWGNVEKDIKKASKLTKKDLVSLWKPRTESSK